MTRRDLNSLAYCAIASSIRWMLLTGVSHSLHDGRPRGRIQVCSIVGLGAHWHAPRVVVPRDSWNTLSGSQLQTYEQWFEFRLHVGTSKSCIKLWLKKCLPAARCRLYNVSLSNRPRSKVGSIIILHMFCIFHQWASDSRHMQWTTTNH